VKKGASIKISVAQIEAKLGFKYSGKQIKDSLIAIGAKVV
jgi:hypothetical protein